MTEERTETEQLIDELTGTPEEQPEDIKQEETQEQDEVQREIQEYANKIEALDEKLAEFRSNSLLDKKREALRNKNYNDQQIERYVSFIEGNTNEEITQSVISLMNDIPPVDNYADPSALNGEKQKPKPTDKGEIGRKIAQRLIKEGKIR